jgi:NifU-like protein involved in Fe-S cluster formation
MLYSDKVMDHFNNPRNVGVIEDADGVGEVGNPVCGDVMKITIKLDDAERIGDIKFQRSASSRWRTSSVDCRRRRCTAPCSRPTV